MRGQGLRKAGREPRITGLVYRTQDSVITTKKPSQAGYVACRGHTSNSFACLLLCTYIRPALINAQFAYWGVTTATLSEIAHQESHTPEFNQIRISES